MGSKIDWIVLISDNEGMAEKRVSLSAPHLESLQEPLQSGIWKFGGGVLSSIPVEGQQKQFNGSCIIAHAATKEEILEQLRKDPFTSGGVWNLEEATILPLSTAFGPQGATKLFI